MDDGSGVRTIQCPATRAGKTQEKARLFNTTAYLEKSGGWRFESSPVHHFFLLRDLLSTEKQEAVQGSLAGDISEIYFDLKRSLELEEAGIPGSDGLFGGARRRHGLISSRSQGVRYTECP